MKGSFGQMWVLAVALVCTLTPAFASSPPATSASAATPQVPLPELPPLETREPAPASPSALRGLDGRLDQLSRLHVSSPVEPPDLGFLTAGLDPALVPAIAQRLERLKEDLNGAHARKVLEQARKRGRRALRARNKRKGRPTRHAPGADGDWLAFILAAPTSHETTRQQLVQLYGMLRILEAIGTTAAVQSMITSYSYFGALVRIDLQRAIGRLKDRAVAALIDATKHDARKVRRWARQQLDRLGRAIPGEAVSSADPVIVADVLRAYGRTRNVDAIGVVLSFANSDRPALRKAARAAVGAIGKPAAWQLRERFRSLTGKESPRGWDWRRTARELFRLHDQALLSKVYERLTEGRRAYADGRFGEAIEAFDQVLARRPLLSGRDQMAPAYFAQGQTLVDAGKLSDAEYVLHKAWRLAADGALRNKIEARLAYLQGRQLAEAGTPDRFILRRAIELDPGYEPAKVLLGSLDQHAPRREVGTRRVAASVLIGLLALMATLFLARRRRNPKAREDDSLRQPAASE